jgi:hypothetical protein
MKKINFLIAHHNSMWAVLLLFAVSSVLWYKLPELFPTFGTYDPAQVPGALLQMVCAAAGIFGCAKLGLWFSLRTTYKYLFGKEQRDGTILNWSKTDWRNITASQRIIIGLAAYLLFITLLTALFFHFI